MRLRHQALEVVHESLSTVFGILIVPPEMNRLLGVVRSKTGEGRMQLWVLAAFPFVIAFGLNAVQHGYFDPLQSSITGQIAVGIAAVLWISSLLVARKVLAVDV